MLGTLAPQARYLCKLVARMESLRWPQDDLIYARAHRARDGVTALIAGLEEQGRRNAMPQWVKARGG